jgi:ribosomal protein L11 methyltransferase
MNWTELKLTIPAESFEAASAILLSAGCPGVAESGDDPVTLSTALPNDERLHDRIDEIETRLAALPESGLSAPLSIEISTIDDADWMNSWKQYYKTAEFGSRLAIKPTWEFYPNPEGRGVVSLDPGMAFGTGGHPTTKLCLEALERHVQPGMTVADVGTGSGILSLAAARLGAETVFATDIDSLPRKIARENVIENDLEGTVHILEMDEFDAQAIACDIVIANIIAATLCELASTFPPRLKPGGLFIGCGIVDERLPDVVAALESAGLEMSRVHEDEIWRLVEARKPGSV